VNEVELRRMASGAHTLQAMQCHNTPDAEKAKICVGFAVKVGPKSIGYRIAAAFGRLDPVMDEEDLMDNVEDVIIKHNKV